MRMALPLMVLGAALLVFNAVGPGWDPVEGAWDAMPSALKEPVVTGGLSETVTMGLYYVATPVALAGLALLIIGFFLRKSEAKTVTFRVGT